MRPRSSISVHMKGIALTCIVLQGNIPSSENSLYMGAVLQTKTNVFWDAAPCILVEVYRHFKGTYCPHHQDYGPDGGGSYQL
jgi:hypothetical protein